MRRVLNCKNLSKGIVDNSVCDFITVRIKDLLFLLLSNRVMLLVLICFIAKYIFHEKVTFDYVCMYIFVH